MHPLSSPLHLVLAKALPAADPAKRWSRKGFFGLWFLLLSQQLWPKLFAIKQQVAASQESLLAHTTTYRPPAAAKPASLRVPASGSRAAGPSPTWSKQLAGKAGVEGSICRTDHRLPRRWLQDLERSCHTSAAPAQTLSFCPGVSSRCEKGCEPFLWDVKALAACWSSSSGWRDVQRRSAHAAELSSMGIPSPSCLRRVRICLCRLSLWQTNCDSALFCPILASHSVCDRRNDQHLGYKSKPCFILHYPTVILPLAEARAHAGEEKPWHSAFWTKSARSVWEQR